MVGTPVSWRTQSDAPALTYRHTSRRLARVRSSICTGRWKTVFLVYVILGSLAAAGAVVPGAVVAGTDVVVGVDGGSGTGTCVQATPPSENADASTANPSERTDQRFSERNCNITVPPA